MGRAPSLDENGDRPPELAKLAGQIFDESKSTLVTDASGLGDALHKAAAPDFQIDGAMDEVGFIRRKLAGADIYFVANTANHPVSVEAKFATTHKFGQRWDADSGTAVATVSDPTGAIPLRLAAYESAIFVFGDEPLQAAAMPLPGDPIADLSTGWTVRFMGMGKQISTNVPADWASDPATRFYSGEADYERSFTLNKVPAGTAFLEVEGGTPVAKPDKVKGPGMRAWYDPPVREAAIVFLNGKRVGSLWHPPYRLNVAGFLKRGQNQVVIKVYNTAVNAWAALPPHDYKPLIAKYGDRFQMQDLDQVRPVSSGLIGTVRLLAGDGQSSVIENDR